MTTVTEAVNLAASIYNPITPGVFTEVISIDSVTVGIIPGAITFAGSEDITDWQRDFLIAPYEHPDLGLIHKGFWEGMEETFEKLLTHLTGTFSIQGHSLGAAHASLLAGLCAVKGIRVDSLYLFAPPRPGGNKLRTLIENNTKTILSFRNAEDPVPLLPLWPYEEIVASYSLSEPTGDPFTDHKIDNYVRGVTKWFIGLKAP